MPRRNEDACGRVLAFPSGAVAVIIVAQMHDDTTTSQASHEVACALGTALADGSWLWRFEARRLPQGFAVVLCDGESGREWTLAEFPETYSRQRFARVLAGWRDHASALADRVDLSWIPRDESTFVTVSGESGLAASILRVCMACGDSALTRWLWSQSDASVAALAVALPHPLAGSRRMILEEMAEWIETLRVPPDLLTLCAHYRLDGPGAGLVALRERLAGDMQAFLEDIR
jgi:hypothetical protein